MYRILAHQLYNNYGGILQAFALQKTVAGFGYRASNFDYLPRYLADATKVIGKRAKLGLWKRFVCRYIGKDTTPIVPFIEQHLFSPFKACFMNTWQVDMERKRLACTKGDKGFIVGSDQVWRGIYARGIESLPFFFLDFATQEQRRRSIAYAASFGSDEWEGDPEETAECARLLKDFKAVSVREHSGIRLCREVFGVEAVQMPDPTLLLEAADYTRVIRRWWTRRLPGPFMSVYLLDETEEKSALTQAVASSSNLYPQQLTAHGDAPRAMDRIPLSVPQWLRCMRDCECVLTDSFHGCVFAIIFNKPFICLGNEARGSARFDSLLGTFGLQERLLTNPTAGQVDKCMRIPIDWERVNAIRHSEQQRAFDFLKQNLEKD